MNTDVSNNRESRLNITHISNTESQESITPEKLPLNTLQVNMPRPKTTSYSFGTKNEKEESDRRGTLLKNGGSDYKRKSELELVE